MNMTITLPLDAKLADLLAKQAARQGVNVEQFALDALRRAAEMPTISELFAAVGAAFEASGRTDEELPHDIKQARAEVSGE